MSHSRRVAPEPEELSLQYRALASAVALQAVSDLADQEAPTLTRVSAWLWLAMDGSDALDLLEIINPLERFSNMAQVRRGVRRIGRGRRDEKAND